VNCLYVGVDEGGLHVNFLKNAGALNLREGGRVIIDGPMGITSITAISTFAVGFVLILATLFIVLNLIHSRAGRAIMALRDNRIAAESIGIPVTKCKLMAFVVSSALAGAAGTLYAMNYSTIIASKFNFNTSILILVMLATNNAAFKSRLLGIRDKILPQCVKKRKEGAANGQTR
jgi:branched-chain amino acid transport system permease protein